MQKRNLSGKKLSPPAVGSLCVEHRLHVRVLQEIQPKVRGFDIRLILADDVPQDSVTQNRAA
jgi:hypothetical protein